jgi:hypothetical protein
MENNNMKCDVCGCEVVWDNQKKITLAGHEYVLCTWDEGKLQQFLHGCTNHSIINIYWGAGRVCWSSWYSIRDMLRKYQIKEVLELGAGLSSELFVNEGMKLISFDVWKEHIDLLSTHQSMTGHAIFHWYLDRTIPPVEELYPGRKWDFVFVDGPQERSTEVKVAMQVSSRFIYLHDPNMGEQSFFPNDEWQPVDYKDNKLFEKRK